MRIKLMCLEICTMFPLDYCSSD